MEGLVIGVVSSVIATGIIGLLVQNQRLSARVTALEAMNAAKAEAVAEATLIATKENVSE